MLTAQYIRALIIVAVIALLGSSVLYARYQAAVDATVTLKVPPRPVIEAPPRPMPEPIQLLAMLRATMLAVDHGVKTGNFTVVRDLGATSFRKANSAAKLAQIFGALSAQGVDLLPIAVVDPTYTKPPAMTAEHMIYLTGLFPIAPRQAAFEILLTFEDGDWRLFAIAIAPAAQ